MNPVLCDAAFGPNPGAQALPVPLDAAESWHRAVALGGQGRYAAARAELVRTRRLAGPDAGLVALTRSAEGSFLRQLGWHGLAAEYDGVALDLAADRYPAAAADALVGLAADALGVGRYALSARLLERARDVVDPGGWRARLRLSWVCAELALATGATAAALGHAEAAVHAAAAAESARHRIKSALLRAAALGCAGSPADALTAALAVGADCRDHGLVPLQWAAAMLSAGLAADPTIGDADTAARATAEAAECAEVVRVRGGYFRGIAQSFR